MPSGFTSTSNGSIGFDRTLITLSGNGFAAKSEYLKSGVGWENGSFFGGSFVGAIV